MIMLAGHHSTKAMKMWLQKRNEEWMAGTYRAGEKFFTERLLKGPDGEVHLVPFRKCFLYRFSHLPRMLPGVVELEGVTDLDEMRQRMTIARLMGTVDNTSAKAVQPYSAVSVYM